MKTRNVVKAQISLPAWQPAEKAESILNQVRNLTRELHAVQDELYRELSEEDGTRRQDTLLRQTPACDALKALQTAADQLRRVLWFYLEPESDGKSNVTEQSAPRAAEEWPLQQARHERVMSEQRPMEAGSFFERLNLVIDGYMLDRGLSRKGKASKS